MYKILTLNNISVVGLERFPRESYEIASEIQHPDAILLRSFKMHGMAIPPTLKAVGRAGAGVNNIPVAEMSKLGIPVFNAPGANANAVKELVLAGMLLAARNIGGAMKFVAALDPKGGAVWHGPRFFEQPTCHWRPEAVQGPYAASRPHTANSRAPGIA